ncbi:MAG: DUF1697 domain-containing protein [Candidatus Velthaea sp.]
MKVVALLRAVNVGNRTLPMAELRVLAQDLGARDVRTVLQTGNLIFTASAREAAAIARGLEAALHERFGAPSPVVVRNGETLTAIIAANPFVAAARDDPAHLVVCFCAAPPAARAFDRLRAAIRGRERVARDGAQLYVVYPDGIGESKFTIATIERHTGVAVTARNWNTVRKIADALAVMAIYRAGRGRTLVTPLIADHEAHVRICR